MLKICLAAAIAALSATGAQAQSRIEMRFEAASVKENRSDGPGSQTVSGDRFTAANMPLRILIRNAFRLQPAELIGGPDWLDAHYDVVAKSPARLTSDTQRQMLQALLADRFKLSTHTETREMPIFALVLARADGRLGPRISISRNDCASGRAVATPSPGARPTCNWTNGPGVFASGGITMAAFAQALALFPNVGRRVVDHTGLADYYDFDLSFNSELSPSAFASDSPSLFTALQEQLGLKLESTRGPVSVLVIDHVERPVPD